MRVAFGTDETTAVTRSLVERLRAGGHEVSVVADPAPWPAAGRLVAEAVTSGQADRGVVCCWTGTGVSMAANKVPGARAALCTDAETARGARRYNDANVVALSLRLLSDAVSEEILTAFLSTEVAGDEVATIASMGEP